LAAAEVGGDAQAAPADTKTNPNQTQANLLRNPEP